MPVGGVVFGIFYKLLDGSGLAKDDFPFLGLEGEGEFEEEVHDFFGGEVLDFSFFEFGEEGFDPPAEDLDAFFAEGEVFFLEGLGVDGLEVLNFDPELPAEGDEGGFADLKLVGDFGVGQALGAELDELVFYGLVDGHIASRLSILDFGFPILD